jgi:hypothetical protein
MTLILDYLAHNFNIENSISLNSPGKGFIAKFLAFEVFNDNKRFDLGRRIDMRHRVFSPGKSNQG